MMFKDGKILLRALSWMKLMNQQRPIPPILYLRDKFQKSLETTIGEKISPEIEEVITIEPTPLHIEGDFTFPIFEVARLLKADYSKISLDIAKNLESDQKYIRGIKVIRGYINVTINPEEFYTDSLRYILNDNLLQEPSAGKSLKNVLLICEQTNAEIQTDQSVCQFISRLYSVFPYKLKTVCLSGDVSFPKIQSFLNKVQKAGKVKDFGNNVLAIPMSQNKFQLLQKQDESPTPLLKQLTLFDIYIKKNNPDIIVFSWTQRIDEFLAIAKMLQTLKNDASLTIIKETDLKKIMNSQNVKILKDLQQKIGDTAFDKPAAGSKTLVQFKDDTETRVAQLISYSPEIFRQLLLHASPKIVMDYSESCKKHVNDLYLSTTSSLPNQTQLSKKLLLQASYKIFDTSFSLFEK